MVKKIFKGICILIIAAVFGTLLFRIYTVNNFPNSAGGIVANEALRKDFADGEIIALTWDIPVAYDSENGNFFSGEPIYFPDEKMLMITVRYNNSLIEKINEEYGIALDEKQLLPLDVSVYADGHDRISPSDCTTSHGYGIYTYCRYVFENVDISSYEYMYIDIYYAGEADYGEIPYGSLEIYDANLKTEPYKLTSADKKALR